MKNILYKILFFGFGFLSCMILGIIISLLFRKNYTGNKNKNLDSYIVMNASLIKTFLSTKDSLVGMDETHILFWKDILDKDNKTIVYRITENQCIECVKSQISFLKSYQSKNANSKIVFLISLYSQINTNNFIQELKMGGLKYEVYKTTGHSFIKNNEEIENLNTPYFFVVMPNCTESLSTFIPIKGQNHFSILFFNHLINDFPIYKTPSLK